MPLNLTAKEAEKCRKQDLHMLEFLIENGEDISKNELIAVQDIFDRLQVQGPKDVLTKSQRGMVMALCRKVEPSGAGWDEDGESPAERNKNVPKGNHVPLPAVLQNLPKKPPGRR